MSIVRKGSVLLATASLLLLPAPSFAAIDTDFGGLYPDGDIACDDVLRANDNSGFTTYALTDDIGSTSGPVTIDDPNGVVTVVGIGTPTTTYSEFKNARQNGQSVNIHADAKKTVVYPGSQTTIPTITTVKTTHNVTCHVHKLTNGNDKDELHEGYNIAPPGLNAQVGSASYETTETTHGTRTETSNLPYIDPNASSDSAQVVICISPGKVPGTWRAQNGYDGSLGTCSRAFYDSIPATTPSVSVPTP
jgi:hypothetical protein